MCIEGVEGQQMLIKQQLIVPIMFSLRIHYVYMP